MTAKQRILAIKLIETYGKQKAYMDRIGIKAQLVEKPKSQKYCNKIKRRH